MKRIGGVIIVGVLALGACSSFTSADNAPFDAGSTIVDGGAIAITDADVPAQADCDGAVFCENFTATSLDATKWKRVAGDADAGATFTPGNGELIIDVPAGGHDGARIQTSLANTKPIRVSFDITLNRATVDVGTSLLLASVSVPNEFIGIYARTDTANPSYFVTLSTAGTTPIGAPIFVFGTPTHIELQISWGSPGGMVTFFASPPTGGKEVQAGAATSFSVDAANPTVALGPARTQGNTSALRIRYSNVLVRSF